MKGSIVYSIQYTYCTLYVVCNYIVIVIQILSFLAWGRKASYILYYTLRYLHYSRWSCTYIVHTLWSCMHAAHHASGSLFEIWICDPCILKYTYNYDACYHCHVFWICVSQNLLYNYYIYSTGGDVSIRSDDKCVMIERYSFHQQCIRAHPLIEGQYSRRSQGWPIRLSQVKHVCPP